MSKRVTFKFDEGSKLKDKISGFSGIVTGRSTWITGCDQYSLTPDKLNKDGEPSESRWFDEGRLEEVPSVKRTRAEVKSKKNGGPRPDAPYIK